MMMIMMMAVAAMVVVTMAVAMVPVKLLFFAKCFRDGFLPIKN